MFNSIVIALILTSPILYGEDTRDVWREAEEVSFDYNWKLASLIALPKSLIVNTVVEFYLLGLARVVVEDRIVSNYSRNKATVGNTIVHPTNHWDIKSLHRCSDLPRAQIDASWAVSHVNLNRQSAYPSAAFAWSNAAVNHNVPSWSFTKVSTMYDRLNCIPFFGVDPYLNSFGQDVCPSRVGSYSGFFKSIPRIAQSLGSRFKSFKQNPEPEKAYQYLKNSQDSDQVRSSPNPFLGIDAPLILYEVARFLIICLGVVFASIGCMVAFDDWGGFADKFYTELWVGTGLLALGIVTTLLGFSWG